MKPTKEEVMERERIMDEEILKGGQETKEK